MPQMAPINWLILFIMFSLILLLFNILNYFCFQYKLPSLSKTKFNQPTMNWKW
uniref:ATP synthase complex subunit 8 n=1 Tax=Macroxyela ferruginea TaxID=48208 RepID=A0A6G5ZVL8_9HYME|nr:ATP synthase F0 subunit 8 [Macroxyela ferruginea]QHR79723.1 ATP synthase F0 subunit 8 [Macroxyela ferruginea]